MQSKSRVHHQPVELIKTGQPGAPRFALGLAYPQVVNRRHQVHLSWGYALAPVRSSSDYGVKIKVAVATRIQTALFHRLPAGVKASLNGFGGTAIPGPRHYAHSHAAAGQPSSTGSPAQQAATIEVSLF